MPGRREVEPHVVRPEVSPRLPGRQELQRGLDGAGEPRPHADREMNPHSLEVPRGPRSMESGRPTRHRGVNVTRSGGLPIGSAAAHSTRWPGTGLKPPLWLHVRHGHNPSFLGADCGPRSARKGQRYPVGGPPWGRTRRHTTRSRSVGCSCPSKPRGTCCRNPPLGRCNRQ